MPPCHRPGASGTRGRPRAPRAPPRHPRRAVDTIDANSPTVFDAGLPAIAYEHAQNPQDAHRLIRQARLGERHTNDLGTTPVERPTCSPLS